MGVWMGLAGYPRSWCGGGCGHGRAEAPGKVAALVSGSAIYEVEVTVTPLPVARWQKLCADCADGIDSLVELLQGRFSDGVMEVLCRPNTGLFPEPAQIAMRCSCPDWATMCKHVAAVLYCVGARLDSEPQLLFTCARSTTPNWCRPVAAELAGEDLGALFGIDLAVAESPPKERVPRVRAKKAPAAKEKQQQERAPSGRKRQAAPLDPWITAAELRQRGVPNHVAQAWLNKGLVTHSGDRGVYMRTAEVEVLVAEYLASARGRKQRR